MLMVFFFISIEWNFLIVYYPGMKHLCVPPPLA